MSTNNFFQFDIDSNMSDLELLFKEYHQKYHNRHLELPHETTEVSDVAKEIAIRSRHPFAQLLCESITTTNSLPENDFINSTEDVATYLHIRYLPAILHSHAFFEVACLLEGFCTNYISKNTIEMKAGDICIIAPNTSHAISAFSDDCILINILVKASTFEHAFLDISSEPDLLSDFFTRTLYHSKDTPYLLFHTDCAVNTRNFIIYAYRESIENRRYKKRMMNSIVSAFFASLLRDHEKDVEMPSVSRTGSDENIVFILRYMQENYRTITLPDLSSFFNYSERHMQRIIKSTTGISFIENIQKLKMTEAAKMLEKGDATIGDISEELGYTTVNNFRNIFKKYYGMTPGEFRNLKKCN